MFIAKPTNSKDMSMAVSSTSVFSMQSLARSSTSFRGKQRDTFFSFTAIAAQLNPATNAEKGSLPSLTHLPI